VPRDSQAKPCTHTTKELSGQVKLKRSCVYTHRFKVKASNTMVDCDGAQISPGNPNHNGFSISGSIQDVLVKNCYVKGGKGIAIRPPERKAGESNDAYRKRSPARVVFSNMHVTRSSNVGAYIHHHVVGATVRDSVIEDNNRPGMYLGAESARNFVRNNLIRNNGFRTEAGGKSVGWYQREGLAVDASAGNLIEGNQFQDNAFGGVLLYKNCWEHRATNPKSLQRIQHSHSNIIRNNRFSGRGIGVWVAARQARDLLLMACGDPTPYKNPITIWNLFTKAYPTFKATFPAPYLLPTVYIWLDHAEKNTITGNTFTDMGLAGVRIEDDETRITGNHFVGDFEYIYLGTPFRAHLLNRPVDRTVITGNTHSSPAGRTFTENLALVPGEHSNTTLQSSVDAGAPTPDSGAGLDSGGEAAATEGGGCAVQRGSGVGPGGALLLIGLLLGLRRERWG